MSAIHDDVISVIDPQNRTGKIQIPLSYIFDTKGKVDAIRTRSQKDLSLCLLFQNGKCNVGGKCHQIHADCDFVRKLRHEAMSTSTCCAAHGDVQSKELQASERTVLVTAQVGSSPHIPVPLRCFAFTQGFMALTGNRNNMVVSLQRVCRLHQLNRCKYGRDCRHVHMCRDVCNSLSGSPAPAHDGNTATPARQDRKNGYAKGQKTDSTPAAVTAATLPTRICAPAPVPLCPDLILNDHRNHLEETASAHSSCSGDTRSDSLSLTGRTTESEPETTSVLDSYLKGWTPASTCVSSWKEPSPLFSGHRSPLDLRMLCTEILGKQ